MCQPQRGPSTYSAPRPSSPSDALGFVKQVTESVEPSQMAVAIVVTFVVVQFRAVLKDVAVKVAMALVHKLFGAWQARWTSSTPGGGRARRRTAVAGSVTMEQRPRSRHFADKQVGSDLDEAVETEQDTNHPLPWASTSESSVPEVLYHMSSYSEEEMVRRSQLFYEQMKHRRSVRAFDTREVPLKVVQNIVKTAGTSPSGANLQPWTFCMVKSARIKHVIREVVEEQEQINYTRRMGAQWVLDVQALNVNWCKPYLTEAPFLLVVMKHAYQLDEQGNRRPTYYNEQSASIAVGILLAAIQNAGLVTVVTTPLNAGAAIREILQRPINEKVSMLLPLGYPIPECYVPDLHKKPVEEIMRIY